jgi:hypothetical protein
MQGTYGILSIFFTEKDATGTVGISSNVIADPLVIFF